MINKASLKVFSQNCIISYVMHVLDLLQCVPTSPVYYKTKQNLQFEGVHLLFMNCPSLYCIMLFEANASGKKNMLSFGHYYFVVVDSSFKKFIQICCSIKV